MKRTEFIKEASKKSNMSQKVIKEVLEALEDVLIDNISNGEDVPMFTGIKFKAATQSERIARNPKTGEIIQVPEKRVMKMKVGTAVKDRISGHIS